MNPKPRVTKCRRCTHEHFTVTDGTRQTDRNTWAEAIAHANSITRHREYARHNAALAQAA